MGENTQEKNLIEKKEKTTLFGKIKAFFKNLFGRRQDDSENQVVNEVDEVNKEFKENIKITEDEETKLLDLQRRYRRGEIAENDLTDEQVDALCELYDRQIAELEKSIEIREKKLAEYKKRKQQKVEENNEKVQEAISALQVLGYSRKEIEKALENIDKESLNVEDIIRKGLSNLAR